MARYLLKAPDEDMQRWKDAAAERGETFADHVRAAVEARSKEATHPIVVTTPEPVIEALTSEGARYAEREAKPFSREQQTRRKP